MLRCLVATAVALTCMVTSNSQAQAGEPNLLREDGEPILVSAFNAPDSFSKYLTAADEDYGVISTDLGEMTPFDADAWVFFLDRPSDLLQYPALIQQTFLAFYPVASEVSNTYTQFRAPSGRSHGIHFSYQWRQEGDSVDARACKIAEAVFFNVTGLIDEDELRVRTSACDEN